MQDPYFETMCVLIALVGMGTLYVLAQALVMINKLHGENREAKRLLEMDREVTMDEQTEHDCGRYAETPAAGEKAGGAK